MFLAMERQALRMGVGGHLSKHVSWSSNRSTFIVVTAASLMLLLGSLIFIHSSRYLPKELNETSWSRFRQSNGMAIMSSHEVKSCHSSEERDLVDAVHSRPNNAHDQLRCTKDSAMLKVFMYDLPPKFHFGMIDTGYADQIWPNLSRVPHYPGGLNLQHSIEYWLTLDLLSSVVLDLSQRRRCTAILVDNSKEADVFYVPFFSSLSYNKYTRLDKANGTDDNVKLQEELVQFLQRQNLWRQSGGNNHLIVMHHPNSLHMAREQLRSAMFIVSDFGRYSHQVANVDKDIVAPYKHMVPTFRDDESTFRTRKILLFFKGAIFRKEGGIIRQQLYEILKDEAGVLFTNGSAQKGGVRSASEGMRSSKFCLHLAGDTPSSNRLFDAIVSHCVPVIISDNIELPFEDQLDYSEFCLFVRSTDALKPGFLMDLLHSIREKEWTRKWTLLKQLDHHFEYQHPSKPEDAVDMIWRAIARRLPSVVQSQNKAKRYARSRLLNKDIQ
ncbi:hypothetical protein KP509_35G042900 [Ceratopteris richardii]|uniref:Exostosin GT47 domain-containing protein n=1 Tax=Ceratopteris richardii TaxID=49495 RepID=A0A8T2QEZ5_CERRI|nr:hypothetical protein KP509_35G042900 [Ceratopteris richardii]